MPRIRRGNEAPIPAVTLERLVAPDVPMETRAQLAHDLRVQMHGQSRDLDRFLLGRIDRLHASLREVQRVQEEIQAILQTLQSTPWHPAVFRRAVETAQGPRALVSAAGARLVVALSEDVALADLSAGEEVFLDQESKVIMAASGHVLAEAAEICTVEERLGRSRVRARWRDEEVLVDLADEVAAQELASGDRLRWDRAVGMAFERLGRATTRGLFLESVEDLHRDRVGGQDENLDLLIGALTAAVRNREIAARYGITGRMSILMVGAAGNGKTLMAKVAAAELQRLVGGKLRFAVVKPAEWESPWVGETERRIREVFESLESASREGPVVLFLDEVESIGRIRGSAVGEHSDRFLDVLLAELDGFVDRGEVAIVTATNRKDLIDPALLQRLSDVEIRVERPGRAAARRILEIHLREDVVYAPQNERDDVIETIASRLFAPNGENEIATMRLRDGTQRTVRAREILSGRTLEQLCSAIRRSALLREIGGGAAGITLADAEEATADVLDRLATTLSPRSCHAHLPDLPHDVEVLAVEPLRRRARRTHRFRNAA